MPGYSWTQPCCEDCWDMLSPGRHPVILNERETERCVHCGLWTQSGIYVRIDPDKAAYPTLKKKD